MTSILLNLAVVLALATAYAVAVWRWRKHYRQLVPGDSSPACAADTACRVRATDREKTVEAADLAARAIRSRERNGYADAIRKAIRHQEGDDTGAHRVPDRVRRRGGGRGHIPGHLRPGR